MHLPSYNCVLCSLSSKEIVQHLFLECEMAKACWNLFAITIDLSLDPLQIFESFRMQLNVSFFMEVIIIMCWSIWTIRNDVIFRGMPACVQRYLDIFRRTFGFLLWRAKKKYFPAIELWLELLLCLFSFSLFLFMFLELCLLAAFFSLL